MIVTVVFFGIAVLLAFAKTAKAEPMPRPGKVAWVSGFTSPEKDGKGNGIEVFRVDAAGKWHSIQNFETFNPSWLLHDPTRSMLYACREEADTVSAYRVGEDGRLAQASECRTSSDGGVHLSLAPDRNFLLVANYSGGTVDVLSLDADGNLCGIAATYDTGRSLPGLEKETSHPHMAIFSPEGRYVLVPDKGRDIVHILRFDHTGHLSANAPPYMFSRPAVGSRHLVFHPARDMAYLVEESDNAVTVCSWNPDTGELTPRQWVSAIPDTWFPKERGGDDFGSAAIQIHLSGRLCFVSNRGHNSIGIFRIHPDTGFLTAIGWEFTRGVQPRFFCLDETGDALFVANVEGHSIMAFAVDQENGSLTWMEQVATTGSPNCIAFG